MHTYKFADCRNIKASELGIDIQGCWRAIPLLPLPTQKKKNIYIYIYIPLPSQNGPRALRPVLSVTGSRKTTQPTFYQRYTNPYNCNSLVPYYSSLQMECNQNHILHYERRLTPYAKLMTSTLIHLTF